MGCEICKQYLLQLITERTELVYTDIVAETPETITEFLRCMRELKDKTPGMKEGIDRTTGATVFVYNKPSCCTLYQTPDGSLTSDIEYAWRKNNDLT